MTVGSGFIACKHEIYITHVMSVSQLTTLDLTDTLNLTHWGGVG